MNRGYYDPPRTATVRKVQWIAPKREGHRAFMLIKAPKKEASA